MLPWEELVLVQAQEPVLEQASSLTSVALTPILTLSLLWLFVSL
jgi:hypothetical protein